MLNKKRVNRIEEHVNKTVSKQFELNSLLAAEMGLNIRIKTTKK